MKSDDEQLTENRGMKKPTNTDQYSKERHFDDGEEGQILTAQPVSSSYTVSCVTNGYDDYRHTVEPPRVSHSEIIPDVPARRQRVETVQSGTNGKSPDRKGFQSSHRKSMAEVQNVYEDKFDNRSNRSVGVSKVRFEESWEDSPARRPDYKVRETSGMSILVRDEIPGPKRFENQRVVNGAADNVDLKESSDNTSSKAERVVKDKQGKATLNAPVQDRPMGTKTNGYNDVTTSAKDNFSARKRDVSSSKLDNGNRLDNGPPQARSDSNRSDERLGLRQLIKIHEIQIAEVAKSAASMKRPLVGKPHEGRLVKVKIVPEIETKQSHVKQNAAKVTFTGNKTSSDGALPKKQASVEVRNNAVESVDRIEELNVKNESSLVEGTTAVKRKRHTVELGAKPRVQEDQKWKRHTAIGLVGFDYDGREVPHSERSPSGKEPKKSSTSADSDAEVEYLRRQPVEPEKHFVTENVQKCDVTELKTTSVKKERHAVWGRQGSDQEKPVADDDSEIPPERPPLPKNFYSSAEEITARPPPPVYKTENHPASDFKTRAGFAPRVEFKPDIEYIPPVETEPSVEYVPKTDSNSEYVPTTVTEPNMGYVPATDIPTNNGYVPKEGFEEKSGFVPTDDFKPNVDHRKKSTLRRQLCSMPLSRSLPAIHVSTAIVQSNGENILQPDNIQEEDRVLGKTRTTREMYEERLARINLIPLDVSEKRFATQDIVASLCSSVESFAWDTSCNVHNLNKNEYLDKLKNCVKEMNALKQQKEDLEKNFERERRDWKRKYEEQQKVANAYQKLEDRYRRQVQELQEALKLCRCTDTETRNALILGQSW